VDMLQLSPRLYNCPILSLRTGGVIATAIEPIINPNNLKVEGFYCQDRFDKKMSLILLYQDIREVIPQGIVVNDHEVLTQQDDIIRLKDLINLHFTLLGKPVITESKAKIGKVNDFAVELESMFVQKLYVSQALRKSLSTSALSVDRTQIVEITDRRIIINDLTQTSSVQATAVA
jgi:sporulation protein YlmC with PRC-barrel domain